MYMGSLEVNIQNLSDMYLYCACLFHGNEHRDRSDSTADVDMDITAE